MPLTVGVDFAAPLLVHVGRVKWVKVSRYMCCNLQLPLYWQYCVGFISGAKRHFQRMGALHCGAPGPSASSASSASSVSSASSASSAPATPSAPAAPSASSAQAASSAQLAWSAPAVPAASSACLSGKPIGARSRQNQFRPFYGYCLLCCLLISIGP